MTCGLFSQITTNLIMTHWKLLEAQLLEAQTHFICFHTLA